MAVLATDTFDRANEVPLASPWVDGGEPGTFSLLSNAVTPTSFETNAVFWRGGITWPNDQYSQAELATTNTVGSDGPGLGVRITAGLNYYRITASHGTTNNTRLIKKVNTTVTELWLRTQAWTSGDTVLLQIISTTLTAKINGVAIGADATDSSHASGNTGVAYDPNSVDATIENWEGGDFVGATSLPPSRRRMHGVLGR